MSTTHELRNSPSQLADLADSIAQHGFASHATEVVALANLLHCEGVRHFAVDVVRDDTQAVIARERAFGHLHGLSLAAPRQLGFVAA